MSEKKNKGGRPWKYKPEFAKQAYKLCLLGAVDLDLANFFEVTETTINNWKNDFPEFAAALKDAKADVDNRVERSLFERAIGYSHPDVHISNYQGEITITDIMKHYPPDPTSMIFWLKNRRKEAWRDRQEHEVSGKDGGPVIIERIIVDPKR